jgi:hypothetical protein
METSTEYGIITLALTFAPTVIALLRGHKSIAAILVLNVIMIACLISVVGIPVACFLWLVGIIWSFTGNTRSNDRKLAKLMGQQIRGST